MPARSATPTNPIPAVTTPAPTKQPATARPLESQPRLSTSETTDAPQKIAKPLVTESVSAAPPEPDTDETAVQEALQAPALQTQATPDAANVPIRRIDAGVATIGDYERGQGGWRRRTAESDRDCGSDGDAYAAASGRRNQDVLDTHSRISNSGNRGLDPPSAPAAQPTKSGRKKACLNSQSLWPRRTPAPQIAPSVPVNDPAPVTNLAPVSNSTPVTDPRACH